MFGPNKKLKAITFSYDDGVTQDIRLTELLNKYQLKCTFNLNSELLGHAGMLLCGQQRIAHYKVHPTDVAAIYQGHEVAVHTLTHPLLPSLPDEAVIQQVEQDRLKLSQLTGYEVVGMAYPCGGENNDDRVADLIRRHTGVRYSRTITSSYSFAPQANLFRFNPTVHQLEWNQMMALGQQFVDLKPDTPQVFYIWGHAYEMDFAPDNWLRLEAFFQLIAGRDDIFYGTNKEVLL